MNTHHSYVAHSIVTCVRSPTGRIALEVSNLFAQGVLLIELAETESKVLRVSLRRKRRQALRVVTGLFPAIVIDTYDTLFTRKESGCKQLERGLRRFIDQIIPVLTETTA